MTSGAKLNHASDNAANFSISTNMSTKISSYEVAEDNVVMAIDMLNTANSSIDLISDKLARLRSLTVLACNGTYGSSSIKAMNAEAATLINEIYRTRNTTEYNGKNIYGANILNEDTIGAQELEVKSSGFMLDIETRDTSAMTSIASVDETKTLAKGTYSISSADELAKFARMQNAGKITPGSEFVQGADIDLSEYAPGTHFNGWGWTPIGMDTLNYDWNLYWFEGTFDGNGYKISNLNIRYDGVSGYRALFAKAKNSTFKNIAIIDGNINITGKGCVCNGALLGQGQNCTVTNCFSNVNIQNESTPNDKGWQGSCAGLVGALLNGSEISYCYSTGNTKAVGTASGLVYQLTNSHMLNCFATGEIVADYDSNGGLIGKLENSTIENCFATGNVYSKRSSNGGLIGDAFGTNNTILNCHATGKVKAAGTSTGDLIGRINSSLTVENCYATGDIEGTSLTGG